METHLTAIEETAKGGFYDLLSELYPEIEIKGNRVLPCPVCGSERQKPCTIYDDGTTIYCHDSECELNNHPVTVQEFKSRFYNEMIKGPAAKPQVPALSQGTINRNREIYKATTEFLHEQLLNDEKALKYQLEEKRHTIETIKNFKVGYLANSDSLYNYLSADAGFSERDILESGVFYLSDDGTRRSYVIQGCYTYPIIFRNEVINIKSKGNYNCYIPQKYAGNDIPWFLNLDALDKSMKVYLVEGENDALSMYEAGYENVIALLGSPSKKQWEFLKDSIDTEYVLAFDRDSAGLKYIQKALEYLGPTHRLLYTDYEGKDPDECLKKHSGKILETEPDRYIKNYYLDPDGKKQPYHKITDEMASVVPLFYAFKNQQDLKTLYLKKDDRLIKKTEQLWHALQQEGYLLDFPMSAINEKKYLEFILESCEWYDRFSCLPERDPKPEYEDPHTKYTHQEINAEKNGSFRKLISSLTLEHPDNDRYRYEYRLAASYLSGFLSRNFDGNKPLFAVIADSQNSGKTSIVQDICEIIQKESTLNYSPNDSFDKVIGSKRNIANRYGLFDNVEFLNNKQREELAKLITARNVPYWEMYTAHSFVPNNTSYFITFNSQYTFYKDIIQRFLIIKLRDSRETTAEEKDAANQAINGYLNNPEKRNDVINDIVATLKHVDFSKQVPTDSHKKFRLWSENMAKILRAFFPENEVPCFSFDMTEDETEIDVEIDEFLEMLDELFADIGNLKSASAIGLEIDAEDNLRISSKKMHELCESRFKNEKWTDSHKKCTRHMQQLVKEIPKNRYNFDFKKIRFKNSHTLAGWTIQQLLPVGKDAVVKFLSEGCEGLLPEDIEIALINLALRYEKNHLPKGTIEELVDYNLKQHKDELVSRTAQMMEYFIDPEDFEAKLFRDLDDKEFLEKMKQQFFTSEES